ncbi:MAG: hypothetical protein KAT70_09660 [Thermoplasmata archaeon]|nr:hypothetical protein [Thermoplasmata archaeon]
MITLAVSGGLICSLLARGSYREQSHRFLLLFLIFSAAYAVSDVLFFNASGQDSASVIAKIDLTMVYLMAISMALFVLSLEKELQRKHALLVLPMLFSIVIWFGLVESVRLRYWGWQVIYDMNLLMVWGIGLLIPISITICSLWRTDRQMRQTHSPYAPKIRSILLGFILLLFFGQFNLVGEIMLDATPPLYSTLLSIPITIIGWTMMSDRREG